MAALSVVHSLARVAEMLEEDAEFLREIAIKMEPEDGVVDVLGPGDDYTPAFTDFGVETLQDLIREHRENAAAHVNAKVVD